MADWQAGELNVQVDTSGLVRPPLGLLVATVVAAVASVLLGALSGALGYVVAVAASILGGVTALQDQKRRGHPSYITLSWFSLSLRLLRYTILLITLFQVARLAISASKGGGLFG